MKKFLLCLTLVGACLLAGGCASFVDGLHEVSWQLEQERLRQEHEAWLHAMYGPRPVSDTSAPGIR